MKASICPLVQVNAMARFLDEPAKGRRRVDLLESRPEHVNIMMILDPASKSIKDKKVNSLTHLLVATFTYKVLHKFADRVTHHKLQEMYCVRPTATGSLHNQSQISW